MINGRRHSGFSLTEVLFALGTMSIGMLFIAGVFPVSIHYTTVTSERSMAAAAADEAFAKVQMIADDFGLAASTFYSGRSLWFEDVLDDLLDTAGYDKFPANEYAYPSTNDSNSKRYFWSAVCRRATDTEVQVTVFVSRKVSEGSSYYWRPQDPVLPFIATDSNSPRPVPVNIEIDTTFVPGVAPALSDELRIYETFFVNPGCTIIHGATGQIYRVLEKYTAIAGTEVLKLDRPWQVDIAAVDEVWVCLLYTSPSPRDGLLSRMPSSA